MKGDPARIYFADDESGWAEDLGDGTYRIDNIPIADGLNMGDIVRVKVKNDRKIVDSIVSRGYDEKTVLSYSHTSQYREIVERFRELGCMSEGYFGPGPGKPGLMIVAHPEAVDPASVIEAMGLEGVGVA